MKNNIPQKGYWFEILAEDTGRDYSGGFFYKMYEDGELIYTSVPYPYGQALTKAHKHKKRLIDKKDRSK